MEADVDAVGLAADELAIFEVEVALDTGEFEELEPGSTDVDVALEVGSRDLEDVDTEIIEVKEEETSSVVEGAVEMVVLNGLRLVEVKAFELVAGETEEAELEAEKDELCAVLFADVRELLDTSDEEDATDECDGLSRLIELVDAPKGRLLLVPAEVVEIGC